MKRIWPLVMLVWVFACGGNGKSEPKSPQTLSDDPLALLPGNALLAGTVDARAFFSHPTFGTDLAKLAQSYIPLSPESGFSVGRDVDRVIWGSYSYQTVDVVAIVVGRFDGVKIKQSVQASASPPGKFVVSSYANHDIVTSNHVGFTVLSEHIALAGTELGLRRVLDRMGSGQVQRDLPPAMVQVLETPGTVAAATSSANPSPLPPEAMHQMPSALRGVRAARAVIRFHDQSTQVAGALSFPDVQQAQAALGSVQQSLGLARLLAMFGIRVPRTESHVEQTDVLVTGDLDDASVRQVLIALPQWIGL